MCKKLFIGKDSSSKLFSDCSVSLFRLTKKGIISLLILLLLLFNSSINSYSFTPETVIDIASFTYSSTTCVTHPTIFNCGMMVFDSIAMVVPGAPGSYILKLKNTNIKSVSNATVMQVKSQKSSVLMKVASSIGDLQKGNGIIIGKYKFVNTLSSKGLIEAHHIIEQRFAKILGLNKDDMLSISLSKEVHDVITKRWKDAIGRQKDKLFGKYFEVTTMALLKAIDEVYFDMPILKELAKKELFHSRTKQIVNVVGKTLNYESRVLISIFTTNVNTSNNWKNTPFTFVDSNNNVKTTYINPFLVPNTYYFK